MTMFAIDGKPGKVRRGEGDGASGESARESYPGSEGGFLGFEGSEEGVGGHGGVGSLSVPVQQLPVVQRAEFAAGR